MRSVLLKFSCYMSIFVVIVFIMAYIAEAKFQNDLEDKIAKERQLENVVVIFHNGRRFQQDEDIVIKNITYKDNQFQAQCVNKFGKALLISGRFEQAINIPGLATNVRTGHIVTEGDIEDIKISESRDLKNYIVHRNELIGKEARHNINAHKIISKNDIRNESIVSKGDGVKILFVKNNLSIEVRGQALESGGQDQLIRVKNLDSNKTLQARIIDAQTVLLGNL